MSQILVRPANLSDSYDLFSWRNDTETVRMSRTSKKVDWSAHEMWFKMSLASNLRYILICESISNNSKAPQKIGMVRYDLIQGDVPTACEISINLNPSARGQKFGAQCILNSLDFIKSSDTAFSKCTQIIAQIKTANIGSIKTFEKAGFCGEPDGYCIKQDKMLVYSLSLESQS